MLQKDPLALDERSKQLYNHFLPKNHPLIRIDEAIDFSFILPLVQDKYDRYVGCHAKHPEMMWRLLFAQFYFNLSDERIILQAHSDLALRLFLRLGVDDKPCHPTTLQKFRFDRLDEDTYIAIHFELLRQAEEKGLLKREERQIFDTSHVRSNTRIVSSAYLLMQARAKVIKEVKKIDEAYGQDLEEMAKKDKEAYREEKRQRLQAEVPKPTKEDKAMLAAKVVSKTLEEVRAKVANRQLEATERLNFWLAVLEKVIRDREKEATDRIVSINDVEAGKGAKGNFRWDGRKLGINMQEESYLIVSAGVAAGNRNDSTMVEPLLDQQKEEMELVPKELSADKAADSGPMRMKLQGKGIKAHIPISASPNPTGKDLFKVDDFRYDPRTGNLTCPAGQTTNSRHPVKILKKTQSREGHNFAFSRKVCVPCPLKAKCQPDDSKYHGRSVFVSIYQTLYRQAERHNGTKEFEEAYGKRGRVEGKISELMRHGARRCRYVGNARSWAQLLVIVAVVNAKRIARMLAQVLAPWPQPGEESVLRAA